MAELIGLINDMSTFVKLGWAGVLVWGVVQFMWYQRARVVPVEMESSPEAGSRWAARRELASVTRPVDEEPVRAARVRRQRAAVADVDFDASVERPSAADVPGFALDTPKSS